MYQYMRVPLKVFLVELLYEMTQPSNLLLCWVSWFECAKQGRNVLRAWQDKAEAARYALMLRAEDLPLGKPTELPMSVRIALTLSLHMDKGVAGFLYCVPERESG